MSRPKTTDRETLVRLLIDEIKPTLFLEAYDIDVVIADEPKPTDAEKREETTAEIADNYPYLCNITLTVYPAFFSKSEARQRHSIRHELAHLVTRAMYDACHTLISKERFLPWFDIQNRNETLTDWIARIAGRGEA